MKSKHPSLLLLLLLLLTAALLLLLLAASLLLLLLLLPACAARNSAACSSLFSTTQPMWGWPMSDACQLMKPGPACSHTWQQQQQRHRWYNVHHQLRCQADMLQDQ
jgi:hypothetical protein